MEQFNGVIRDVDGVPVKGALVYVYDQFGEMADIFFGDGAPMNNPMVTPETGYWEAWVGDGLYTVKVNYGGRERYVETGLLAGGPADLTLRGELASDTEPGASLVRLSNGKSVQEAIWPMNPAAVPNPSFSRDTYNAYNVINLNNTDYAALFRAQQGPGFNGTDAFTVAFTVPEDAPIHMAMGIHVEGVSDRAAVPGLGGDIGIYAAMTVTHDDGNVHALNLVCNDSPGCTGQTIQNEFDFNVYSADTSVAGLDLILNTALPGTFGNAFMVRAFQVGRWGTVLFSPGGSAENVVYGGATESGNNKPSQKIVLNSMSSGGVSLDTVFQADANGGLNVRHPPNPSTKAAVHRTINTSADNVTTKIIAHQFNGTDTLGAQKNAASFTVTPGDGNWAESTIAVNVRTADATALAGTFVPGGFKFPELVFGSTLPAPTAALNGMVAYVSGVATPTYRSTLSAGSDRTLARCDGTNWIALG